MEQVEVTAKEFMEIVNTDCERNGHGYTPEIVIYNFYICYESDGFEYDCRGSKEELYDILHSLSVNIAAIVIR